MLSNAMGFLDFLFRPRARIVDMHGLADFLDANAAFLMQKGIYEYSRARAGPYAKTLMTERGFTQAVELARWQAYPLGLGIVAEMAEGVLRPPAPEEQRAFLDRFNCLALSVIDRYPQSAVLTQDAWRAARGELAQHLARIGLHPPKRVMDIPEPFATRYFELMPIHASLRGRDFPTMRNYLRITLCNIHDEFTRRADAAALVARLRAAPPPAPSVL
ncbi:MAG: hypothetical protein HY056_14735 [Proteobacteria bacterium]|nr:hypothetical protein [Pseudomonadota bacterium]